MSANLEHTFRNLQEQLLRALGIFEAQQPQEDFADSGFEMFSANGAHYFPITEAKAYANPRDVRLVDLIVVHVTAVTGGFGVSKSAVKRWTQALMNDHIAALPPGLQAQFSEMPEDLNLFARRLALWERFANVPYHQVALRNGDCIANHPLSRHTWHGNGGNVGVGFAVDCGSGEKLTEWMIETARRSLSILIARLQRETLQSIIRIAPHRAYSAARREDPGAYVWREVIEWVVSHSQGVRIDYETKRDGGLQVPNTWDEAALYDAKGRRLAA